jgi:uncharacterized phage protein (TIGR01671 family)
MSRIIQFRAWDTENKQMIYHNPLSSMPECMTWTGTIYREGKVMPWLLQQCTGLKDKHGKYIYDGDIIKFYDTTPDDILLSDVWEVIWDKSACGFIMINSIMERNLDVDPKCLEVIGNIIETPELLK